MSLYIPPIEVNQRVATTDAPKPVQQSLAHLVEAAVTPFVPTIYLYSPTEQNDSQLSPPAPFDFPQSPSPGATSSGSRSASVTSRSATPSSITRASPLRQELLTGPRSKPKLAELRKRVDDAIDEYREIALKQTSSENSADELKMRHLEEEIRTISDFLCLPVDLTVTKTFQNTIVRTQSSSIPFVPSLAALSSATSSDPVTLFSLPAPTSLGRQQTVATETPDLLSALTEEPEIASPSPSNLVKPMMSITSFK